VVETPAAEPRQPAAEQAQPDVAGLGIDVERRDHAERQAVLLAPTADLAGLLVDAGQPVLGADPDLVAVGLDREDVVVGQAILDREVLPLRVDVRHSLGARRRSEGHRGDERREQDECGFRDA